MSALSSAKSYTSSIGATSSAVSSGSSTSGSSSGLSSMLRDQARLGPQIAGALGAGLPNYDPAIRLPGDVFFHVDGDVAGHTNMMCNDTTNKVDSVDPDGVRVIPLARDRHTGLVFRFHRPAVAQQAALLAESWAGRVKYSDGALGMGVTFRVISAVFGSSNFGRGAHARLLKYQSRVGQAPKNVICSEMVILAFQLSMLETDADFIPMDAKHSLPSTLMKYFLGAGAAYWARVAVKH